MPLLFSCFNLTSHFPRICIGLFLNFLLPQDNCIDRELQHSARLLRFSFSEVLLHDGSEKHHRQCKILAKPSPDKAMVVGSSTCANRIKYVPVSATTLRCRYASKSFGCADTLADQAALKSSKQYLRHKNYFHRLQVDKK
jgi:hypothetical protein